MDKHLIDEAARCLRVVDVYQRNTTVELSDEYDPMSDSQEVGIQYRVRPLGHWVVDLEDDTQLVRFDIECGIRLVSTDSNDDDSNLLCEISVHYISDYAVVKDLPEVHVLKEFGIHNVPYHVWPYLREYIHSTCMRCRLPVVTIPMYRVSDERRKSGASKKTVSKKSKKNKTSNYA